MDAGISNFSEFDKIKNFSIVLLGDADSVGFKAKLRIYENLLKKNLNVQSLSIIELSKKLLNQTNIKSAKDINDILKNIKGEIF